MHFLRWIESDRVKKKGTVKFIARGIGNLLISFIVRSGYVVIEHFYRVKMNLFRCPEACEKYFDVDLFWYVTLKPKYYFNHNMYLDLKNSVFLSLFSPLALQRFVIFQFYTGYKIPFALHICKHFELKSYAHICGNKYYHGFTYLHLFYWGASMLYLFGCFSRSNRSNCKKQMAKQTLHNHPICAFRNWQSTAIMVLTTMVTLMVIPFSLFHKKKIFFSFLFVYLISLRKYVSIYSENIFDCFNFIKGHLAY